VISDWFLHRSRHAHFSLFLFLLLLLLARRLSSFPDLGRDAVNPVRVDLDARVKLATGFLKVDAVTLLQQRHAIQVSMSAKFRD
jgi:hypothetical protein